MKRSYCPNCKMYVDYGRFCGTCGSSLTTIDVPEVSQSALAPNNIVRRNSGMTIAGVIMLGLYIGISFIMSLSEASDYIKQCERQFGGVSINVSRFWFFLIFVISAVLFIATLFGRKSFSITADVLVGVLLVFVIVMAINTEEGYHGLSVDWLGGSIDFDKGSELSKALAYNCYGMAAIKMVWLWILSLIFIIIGRVREGKSKSDVKND